MERDTKKNWNESRHFKILQLKSLAKKEDWMMMGVEWHIEEAEKGMETENWKILCVPLENLPPH